MQSAKEHITSIVENYIRLYPEDFQTVKDGIEKTRHTYEDDDATAKLQGVPMMRALFEIPQDLSEMLIMGLTEEEMEWFKAGGKNRKEGSLWFARTFKAFALPRNTV